MPLLFHAPATATNFFVSIHSCISAVAKGFALAPARVKSLRSRLSQNFPLPHSGAFLADAALQNLETVALAVATPLSPRGKG